MLTKLLQSIGVGTEMTSKLDHLQWLWARPAVLWVGLVLLIPIIVFIWRRQRQNLPHIAPAARHLMTVCRAGVLLLLVIVLAGPYLRLDEQVTQKPLLAVIIDDSASMQLPAGSYEGDEALRIARAAGLLPADADGKPAATLDAATRKKLSGMSRQELLEAVITEQRKTLEKPLTERFDLRAYRVARQVRSASLDQPPAQPPPAEELEETNLGRAIEQALDDSAGRPLAGIVLFSDGRWTTGPEPSTVIRRLAGASRHEQSAAAPVWTVPVGSARPLVDIAILDVLAPRQVAEGDSVVVVPTIESQGLDNRSVAVKLLAGDGQVLDETKLTLSARDRQQVTLNYEARQAGAVTLSVQVDELPEEQVKANNRHSLNLEVDAQKLRVLYLEGYPRWDFRFLDHALRRDHGLEVHIVTEAQLQAAGVKPQRMPAAAKLPEDAAGFAEFHVVILGDISPVLLPARLQEQLAKAVEEQGVGLMVQAGPRFMPGAFAGGALARLLPFQSVTHPEGVEAPAFAPFAMKVTAPGSIHPAFRLYDSASQNRRVWGRMAEFYWSAAPADLTPAATVLAEYENLPIGGVVSGGRSNRPLIVEHFAGRGRVLFIGTDSTYRWRRNIGTHLFYRFWGQALRHVARDKERGAEQSWLEVHPPRIEPGEQVSIELYAADVEGQPLEQRELSVQISGRDYADTLRLARSAQPGHFRATWQPRDLGEYRLNYRDTQGRSVAATVQIAGSGRELRRPIVDRDTLAALADASGGGMLELHELSRLPGLLQGEPQTVARTQEKEIWDNWLTLVLLVGLYCTDVGVRRLLGLT